MRTTRTARQPERVIPPDVAITTFDEVRHGYTRDQAISEAQRGVGLDLSAARARCPFGVDVEGLVAHVAAGRFDEARALVVQSHPWPGILGRHCGKYCEKDGSEDGVEDALAIGLLERAAAEYGVSPNWDELPVADGPRVAVVGAGAAGVAAAFGLRCQGYRVTVHESLPNVGGMLFAGYPSFRLPLQVVEEEIDLAAWGIEARLDERITQDMFDRLRREHDIVVVASGLHRERPLGVPGEEAEGVLTALDVLTMAKQGQRPNIGKQVLVIGAGHTAHDAARTCRRLGAEVRIVYRGSLETMPVTDGKQMVMVKMLAAEGIDFVFRRVVVAMEQTDGRVSAVHLVDTNAASVDVDAGVEIMTCDTVVRATGVFPDTSFLPDAIGRREDGLLIIDEQFETTIPRVFAIGTIVGTRKTVGAFAEGLRAAESIGRRMKESAA